MKAIYFSVGVNPRGTTVVLKRVEPKRPQPFSPEWFLSELDRAGMAAASRTFGEMLLRVLKLYHPAAFAPYATLVMPVPANDCFAASGKVETIAPFDYHGAMRPQRLGVGIADDADAVLLVPFVGAIANGPAEPLALAQLDRLGVDAAAKTLGERVLRTLARFHRDAFGPFSRLTGLPVATDPCPMKAVRMAVGINPAGTALVMKPVYAPRPDGYGPVKFLSELDRHGVDAASGWIGAIALRSLAAHHAATFAPFARLAAPPHDRHAASPFDGNVVALAPYRYDGVMQVQHIEIGVADSADALMLHSVGAGAAGDVPRWPLARLNALGFAAAAGLLGAAALRTLAHHCAAQLGAYPNLIAPPPDSDKA